MRYRSKIIVLAALFAACVAGLLAIGPIPQDPTFHDFADRRGWLGIPNFADVVTNIAFLGIGLWGLWRLRGPNAIRFEHGGETRPYLIFFAAVAAVAAGSAYYHAAPDNGRLFWDRLPITVAFMSLYSAILADRVHRAISLRLLLPLLIVLGVASLLYWAWSEARGIGDLRPYILVQLFPMLSVPAICLMFRPAATTGGRYIVWILVWYAIAKVLEVFDREVFDMLGGAVSGHSLKHLAAAIACVMVLRMIEKNRAATI